MTIRLSATFPLRITLACSALSVSGCSGPVRFPLPTLIAGLEALRPRSSALSPAEARTEITARISLAFVPQVVAPPTIEPETIRVEAPSPRAQRPTESCFHPPLCAIERQSAASTIARWLADRGEGRRR